MVRALSEILINNVTLSIFICLALGYSIGKVKIKSFSLGATVGTLIIGLIVGQVGTFDISPVIKTIFFSLFIFVIGYEVGPAFFDSFKKSGIKLIVHSVFLQHVHWPLHLYCLRSLELALAKAQELWQVHLPNRQSLAHRLPQF